VFARLFALCLFLLCLMTLLPLAPAQAVGCPACSAGKNPARGTGTLGQSLDEVIKSWKTTSSEPSCWRPEEAARRHEKAQPITEEGVLGLIGGTLASLENSFPATTARSPAGPTSSTWPGRTDGTDAAGQ
jgi:hypothetical protein